MRHVGLWIRMAVAGSILFSVYAAFALVLFAGGIPLIAIAVISIGFVSFQYLLGMKLPLWSVSAREVSADRFPHVHATVDRLSGEMGIEKPRLMVADMGVPNAFTVGRKGAAVVVVASELLYVLDDDEVKGVLAHELAHVRNRDVIVMVIGHSIATGMGLIVEFAVSVSPKKVPGSSLLAFLLGSLTEMSLMVFVLAISRYREYIADADAAEIVDSDSLANALESISEVGERSPAEVESKVAALCIFGGDRGFFEHVFATHPPVEKRIERLQSL